ncbi:uncharacterized protein LY89DRAFT_610899 [Mollisia scopiformis]|uniref:C2H2 type master regulator of conidiophore development brlA n=1 Tax=Mollisia scopiformis TaxID=149040 RepID=A0A194XKC6_MOLSC|nr:uncharacterized protein LY89DRAFT_610899 [Mollisia scopiformis]KUJ20613.1 hypothetical protein LY89DRAFT_610899 [Mollisia scopiformis]
MNEQGQYSNPLGFGQQMPGDDFWPQPHYTSFTDTAQPTQSAPFFQDYYGNILGYGTQLKASNTNAFSGQPLYPHYQAPNLPHELYTFAQRTRPAQAPLPPLKRQKIAQISVDENHAQINKKELGNGQDGTQSECCSSCPSGAPCDEPNCAPCDKTDCDEVVEEVVPCTRKSCAQPVCPNPCLKVAVQQQEARLNNGIVPTERRISSWENTQWSAEVPRAVSQGTRSLNGLLDPALEVFDGPEETPASGSPAPTTPSMAKNVDTPHSPNGEAPTPHSALFPQTTQADNTAGVLSGTGALFNPATDSQWHNFGQDSDANYQFMFQCGWSGCGQPFVSQHDYFSHFHRDHIDPQMTFDCPAQADTCPSPIKANPLEHLQNDHGYNFNMGTGGFSCPAPSCPQGETFLNPAMLHNHFDVAHAIPAHGSLQCLVDTCGNYFQDYNQLWSHVTLEHQIPQQPKDSDIDLAFPTAPVPIQEPLMRDEPDAAAKPNAEAENEGEEDLHICKWKLQPGVVCSMDCGSEDALQKHIKTAHLDLLDKRSGYKCQWEGCNREEKVPKDKIGFTQRGKLERHMATHTNYKSSRCDWPGCGRLFSAPQAMRQHYLLHTGEKPWVCKHCGKKFPQQSACTIHERTHTKEKPLECNICGMKFSESSNLSKHRRTHEDKQSHECTFKGCGKSFCRLDQLRRHRLVHRRKGGEDEESVTERTETGSSSGTA